MNIIIDNTDFWDGFDAMKYWSYAKTSDPTKRREEIRSYVLGGAYMGAIKVDGIWAMIIKDNDGIFHLRSRTPNVNKTYADKAEWIPSITANLSNIPNGTVLLGEIYKYGDEGSRKTTSILNCLKDKSLERQSKTPLHFYCFDCLAYKGKQLLDTPIEKRIERYINKELSAALVGENIEVAKYYDGEELWEAIGNALASGREGMVIQKKSAPYTCGKRPSKLTIKIKKEINQTIDAFIDGDYKPATKNYSGKDLENWQFYVNDKTEERLPLGSHYDEYIGGAPITPVTKPYYYGAAGAISFSVMKDDKPVHIAYISGVTDEMKLGVVKNPDKWIGQVYELSAMEVEKTGLSETGYSLRHGKVIRRREDKTPKDCDFSQIESK